MRSCACQQLLKLLCENVCRRAAGISAPWWATSTAHCCMAASTATQGTRRTPRASCACCTSALPCPSSSSRWAPAAAAAAAAAAIPSQAVEQVLLLLSCLCAWLCLRSTCSCSLAEGRHAAFPLCTGGSAIAAGKERVLAEPAVCPLWLLTYIDLALICLERLRAAGWRPGLHRQGACAGRVPRKGAPAGAPLHRQQKGGRVRRKLHQAQLMTRALGCATWQQHLLTLLLNLTVLSWSRVGIRLVHSLHLALGAGP